MIPLSIVIATFNRSAYLLRTLESLAGQTLPAQEFEILVVNNNSTDDTPAVFAGFARQHPELRLRMVAEPVQGISYARNRGVAEAEGECIVFIDEVDAVGSTTTRKPYRTSLKATATFSGPDRTATRPAGRSSRCTRLRCPAGTRTT